MWSAYSQYQQYNVLSTSASANLAAIIGNFKNLLESMSKDTKLVVSCWHKARSHCSTMANASASVAQPPNSMMIMGNVKPMKRFSIFVNFNKMSVNLYKLTFRDHTSRFSSKCCQPRIHDTKCIVLLPSKILYPLHLVPIETSVLLP